MTEDDVLLAIERQSRQRTEAVKALLLHQGRPDLVVELEASLRDVRTGVSSARSVWHSISEAQRRTLGRLRDGASLVRRGAKYDAVGGRTDAVAAVCDIRTARALCAHELLACDGSTFDPEARFALTERGRFVLSLTPTP
jgi:hypothetical protein